MNAKEFLRHYESTSEDEKAELINGIVYIMPQWVSAQWHCEPDSLLQTWMGMYAAHTPGVKSGTNPTLDLSPIDVVQPDGLLRILPEHGGICRYKGKFLKGRPEFVFEIANSSASIDRNQKKETYRLSEVPEYLLWRTADKALDWWVWEQKEYRSLPVRADGILRSRVFPGLWLDAKALLADDGARVLAVLQKGLKSLEHREFIESLKARKTRTSK